MLANLGTMWHLHTLPGSGMFTSILEYAINADMYYRLWMAAETQTPTPNSAVEKAVQPRQDWFPPLVEMFEDVREVPGLIRMDAPAHLVDSQMRFHTGNKTPTIKVGRMELYWGVDKTSVFSVQGAGHVIEKPVRAVGPCKITFSDLQMWHHQNIIHRRRGDAIIAPLVEFEWNTKREHDGMFRTNGPFKVTVTNFRAAYNMGTRTDAAYDNLSVSWGTENGIRLGESRVQDVIRRNEIGINYHMVDSAFTDPGEEFIFWDEVGREQQAA